MGLDTSAHPFDVSLLQARIIPFILKDAPVDDLVDRAVANQLAAHRANCWGLAVSGAHSRILQAQFALHPPPPPARPRGLLSRLFGGQPEAPPTQERPFCGLPGFDSDLLVWGRPFFIDAATPGEAVQAVDRYLAAAGQGEAAIDAAARDSLASLERKRGQRPDSVPDTSWAVVTAASPLTDLSPDDDQPPPDAADLRARIVNELQAWRRLVAETDPEATFSIDPDGGETCTVAEAQAGLPLRIVTFMSALTPGWMSRGYGYASNLMDMVKVKESLFETPEAPFAALASAMPGLCERFDTTIPENFSLGGYVPPERVSRLIAVLDENRDAMIRAFHRGPPPTPQALEMMAGDWTKLREAAEYARAKGMGYLECAEVYSGPLGWMN